MTNKEAMKEDAKEARGGEDELEALDALEKEAAEYNKVALSTKSFEWCTTHQSSI